LVVADAGFVGYELCQRVLNAGQSFLLRVGGNIRLLDTLASLLGFDDDTAANFG